MESLNLVAVFLEDGQEKLLKRWFGGKIVGNSIVRDVLKTTLNKLNQINGGDPLPIKEALSDVYSIYSSYTHSGYVALFDFIDVFREDFDFDQFSQFHYNRENFDLIDSLYVNILLGLKNFYIRTNDEENLAKVEALLSKEKGAFATPAEIGKELQRYK
jgi:hypothetical protein